MKLCIVDADYVMEKNRPVVRLWCKDERGRTMVAYDRKVVPYFYVEPKDGDVKGLEKRISSLAVEGERPERVEIVRRKILGKEKTFVKVFVRIPADVPKFRELVKIWKEVREEYEYGIALYKRYLIDKGLTPMGWAETEMEGEEIVSVKPLEKDEYPSLRVMAFDIETIAEKEGDRIIMISFAGSGGFKKVITYGKNAAIRGVEIVKGEKELLEMFVKTIQEEDPDILVGYNTDRFDFIKIEQQARKYNVDLVLGRDEKPLVFPRRGRVASALIGGRVHVDLYNFVNNILSTSLSTETLTLDRVARELIGKGKIPLEWEDIERAWRKKDLKTIASYCLQDALLTLELADYLLPQIYELCRVTGQTLFDTSRMFYSQLVEWLYIRKAYELGEMVPPRPSYDEIQRRRKATYLGGYVHPPKEGMHEKIAIFDFASLYPSITITHNISPETLDCSCCKGGKNTIPELNHHFCTKKTGFVTMVLEDLVIKRTEIKEKMKKLPPHSSTYRYLDNRQYALKILANASYGYYGYAGSRWYSKVCAESITALGRMYIKSVIALSGKMGFDVIYGDTDSMFLRIEKKEIDPFLKKVNAILPGIMELDFRGYYEAGIFVLGKTGAAAKKRYALIDSKGEITIRGLERVRRDWSGIAKDTQENVLKAVLKDRKLEKAVKIVRQIIRELREGKVKKEQLIIYTQLTKSIGQYEQIGPHVAVAKKIISRGGQVREGETIRYIVTKGSGSISERSEPADEAKDYDPDYYINNQVLPAAMRILSGFGYTEDDFLTDRKKEGQISLEKYMKR